MKTTEQNIEDLHFEHKLWESEANFFKDELRIYRDQVEGVGKRNSSAEVKDKVSYFEEQFDKKNQELEALRRETISHEHDLYAIEKNNFKGTGGEYTDEHRQMKRKHEKFKEEYSILKKEFRLFLEEWM